LAPRPWDPPRDGGPGAREARLTIGPASLHPLWHRAAQRQPRAPRRHPQTVLPGPTLPQCEVGGRTRRGLAAGVTPDTPPAVHVSNEPLHGVRGAMGPRPVPPYARARRVAQPPELAAAPPPLVAEALPTARLGAAAVAARGAQLQPRRVDDAAHGRSGPASLGPGLRGRQKTQEPRPRGEAGA